MGHVQDRMRAYNNPDDPTPEQLRRSFTNREVKRARARLHAALATLNTAQGQCGSIIKRGTPPDEARRALDTYDTAVAPILAAAKLLPATED